MIEVKIPKEIRAYKTTFLLGLTLRQSIWAIIALAINVPLYLFLSRHIGSDAAGWIIIITTMPPILVGFVKYNGMHFERFAACIFRFLFTEQKRRYVTENFYSELWRGGQGDYDSRKKEKRSRKKQGR